MSFPSFEELAELVRTSAGFGRKQRIDPVTELLRDLMVNGKRTTDVLNAIERQFGIRLSAEIHSQLQDSGAARSNDADEAPVIQSLFASSRTEENPWTVGRLYRAVLKELSKTQKLPVSRQ